MEFMFDIHPSILFLFSSTLSNSGFQRGWRLFQAGCSIVRRKKTSSLRHTYENANWYTGIRTYCDALILSSSTDWVY